MDELNPNPEAELDPQSFALVYEELRRIAAGMMRGERGSHTLQPTALAHEAFLRLCQGDATLVRLARDQHFIEGQEDDRWRAEFLLRAARRMRQVLIDHARARNRKKRAAQRREMPELVASQHLDPVDMLALDEALNRLARLSERQAQVVELRYFGGLTLAEAASVLGIGRETAKDHWALARAWLNRELSRGRRP